MGHIDVSTDKNASNLDLFKKLKKSPEDIFTVLHQFSVISHQNAKL